MLLLLLVLLLLLLRRRWRWRWLLLQLLLLLLRLLRMLLLFSHLLPGRGRIRCLPPVASGSLSASSSSSPEKISPIMCKLWSII
jgi:hypothetical protein